MIQNSEIVSYSPTIYLPLFSKGRAYIIKILPFNFVFGVDYKHNLNLHLKKLKLETSMIIQI